MVAVTMMTTDFRQAFDGIGIHKLAAVGLLIGLCPVKDRNFVLEPQDQVYREELVIQRGKEVLRTARVLDDFWFDRSLGQIQGEDGFLPAHQQSLDRVGGRPTYLQPWKVNGACLEEAVVLSLHAEENVGVARTRRSYETQGASRETVSIRCQCITERRRRVHCDGGRAELGNLDPCRSPDAYT
jgi:hypothetical protein